MNDNPPSTSGAGGPGLFARIKRAITGQPWSRDEIHTFIQSDVDLDAEEKSMLAGVLEVSETQAREVMCRDLRWSSSKSSTISTTLLN